MAYIGKTPASAALTSGDISDGIITTSKIADDAATADKIANAVNTEIAANTAKTTNATHSGEVTGSGALTIADNIVDEANLKVSNSPTNGYFLSAQSGNTGGLTWAEAGGGGKILQVKTAFKSSRQSISSTSFEDVTGMSVSITPASTGSKIFISATFNMGEGTGGYETFINLVRGSTNIMLGDSAGSTQRCSIAVDNNNTTNVKGGLSLVFLDSPSTTSSTTYKIQGATRSGGIQVFGGTSNTTLSYFASAPCSMVVMEVGA